MGLLDDAIREHLELKRRHGANPTEIADLEREAFGPARRAPEPLAVPDEAPVPEPGVPAADAEPEVLEPPVAEAPVIDEPEPAARVLPREPEPPPRAPMPAAPEPEDFEPEPELDAEPRRPEDLVAETEGEDVLEETPEFLQDTPDHDRLWFEQRPPKDFDFDE